MNETTDCHSAEIIVNFIMGHLDSIPSIASAIAAIGSLVVAFLVYRYNKKQNEHAFKSDLYNLISTLIGFVDFVQKSIAHNTTTLSDCQRILDSIAHLNKSIIDCNKRYFFNDGYNSQVLEKTAVFIEQYLAWKGFKVTRELESFNELNELIALQHSAADVLLEINQYYRERYSKVLTLLSKDNIAELDKIVLVNKKIAEQVRYVNNNLYLLEAYQPIQEVCKEHFDLYFKQPDSSWEDFYSYLMAACYQTIINGKIDVPTKVTTLWEAYQFFFNSYITSYKSVQTPESITLKFINEDGKEITIDRILDLLAYISFDFFRVRCGLMDSKDS